MHFKSIRKNTIEVEIFIFERKYTSAKEDVLQYCNTPL